MQTHFPRQRRNSNFTLNLNYDYQNMIPTIKKSQSSIKFPQFQTFKQIQQGYFTPNTLKIKFMCKNHINTKSTHFFETSDGEKIYYCSACSIEFSKQGFSVKNLNLNQNINKNQSEGKFEPKRFDFWKKKCSSYQGSNGEVLKVAEENISQLERMANQQIIRIDEYGKNLLKELNTKFSEVIRFLHDQKQNCIQMIFDRIDQLKRPFHEVKNGVCNQKWELENVQSRLDLLVSQQSTLQMKQSLATISSNEYQKVSKIVQKTNQISKIMKERIMSDERNFFQSLGAVQEIIENVYSNFLVKNEHKNILSDLSRQMLSKQLCQQTVSEFPSPISVKNSSQPDSNETLKQEIEIIENTIKRDENSKSYAFLTLNNKAQPINEFTKSVNQHKNHAINKRGSQITTISSLTNLMA